MENRSDKTEDLRKLLKRPVNAKTSAEEWTIIGGFSIRQIKDALQALPPGEHSEAVQNPVTMLYFCWAQIDPLEALEAANRVVEKNKNKTYPLYSVLTAWMKQDPDAACQWAISSSETVRKDAFS